MRPGVLNRGQNIEGNSSVALIFIVSTTFSDLLQNNSNTFTMRYFQKNSSCINNVSMKSLQFVILADKLTYK